MTIAIANPDTPTNVNLWCTVEETRADGSIKFYVINGNWNGILYTNGTFKVIETGEFFPGIKVWEGDVPGKPGAQWDYNEAIHWINGELSKEGY